jgi:hypothetical protein
MSSPLELLIAVVGSRQVAETILRTLREGGYVCVPEEATEQMLEDAWGEICDENGRASWRAMVTSALARQAQETQEK